jgi:phage shock protein A
MSGDLTIKSLMTELTGIKTEVKTRRAELSKMLEREKEIKTQISSFLKEKNQPGVKDTAQGVAVITEKVSKIVPKKKKDSKNDALNVLRHYMDDSKAQKIFSEMEESRKGDKVEKEVLKIIKI